MSDDYADKLFPRERQEIDGQDIGFNEADLCRAVEVWYHAQAALTLPALGITIGEAADVFNVRPEFLANALDRQENPYFFATKHSSHTLRTLDCDGV